MKRRQQGWGGSGAVLLQVLAFWLEKHSKRRHAYGAPSGNVDLKGEKAHTCTHRHSWSGMGQAERGSEWEESREVVPWNLLFVASFMSSEGQVHCLSQVRGEGGHLTGG